MVANFESVQKLGKEQFEAVTAVAAVVTKGWQSIASETTDYSKKSFEKSRVAGREADRREEDRRGHPVAIRLRQVLV